jgi:GT2 family glycosyltransferase
MNETAHYIISIHNKEDLIFDVLKGIEKSTKDSNFKINIICVFDGCVDKSEEQVDKAFSSFSDNYKLHKLYENDVHELLSLNKAIKYIETIENSKEDLIFFLQDDVILNDTQINESISYLYEKVKDLGYISFRCGLSTDLQVNGILFEHSFCENECGHWKQLNLNHFQEFKNKHFKICEVVIKSPTCIKKQILDEVGIFDEKLAPFGHDDLDLCIRLNELGYKNAVYGINFISKLDWGGTRTKKNPKKDYHVRYDEIVYRNKIYLSKKHINYFLKKYHNITTII